MAADEPTIKVRRHRESERVIYAGAPAMPQAAQEGSGEPAAPASGKRPPAGPAEGAPPAAGAPADAFHETTLDDIESSTMSGLQKGIIVGAVVLIVACIAWYVLFMS